MRLMQKPFPVQIISNDLASAPSIYYLFQPNNLFINCSLPAHWTGTFLAKYKLSLSCIHE